MTIPLLGQCLIDKNQEGFHNNTLESPCDSMLRSIELAPTNKQ